MDYTVGPSTSAQITEKSVQQLLGYFARNTYSANTREKEANDIMNHCIKLLKKDYNVFQVSNENGRLSFQYPSIIPIMESERNTTTIYENQEETKSLLPDAKKTRELFENAKYARCRQRFPVPVILVKGKYICRSATLASVPEVCYRAGLTDVGMDSLFALKEFLWPIDESMPDDSDENEQFPASEETSSSWPFCDKIRNEDKKLLRDFNVNTIIDVMVEKRKVKHGLYVSASEKVDRERFSDFKLASLPYPGCEFFKKFHKATNRAEGLKYDWSHPSNDATLSLPNDIISRNLMIDWKHFKEWELITLTQNYMKYIINCLQEDTTGILIHCISGWDRTPLFISLLRLSLWADGLIHQSLNEVEITYFTLAYDWFLYGHDLANRLYKKEEILGFCFEMLKYLTSEEFSARTKTKKFAEDRHGFEDSCGSVMSSHTSVTNLCQDENISHKARQLFRDDLHFNENSNSSDSTVMDVCYEENSRFRVEMSHIYSNGSAIDTSHKSKSCADEIIGSSPESTVTNSPRSTRSTDSVTVTPVIHHQSRRTSPVPIAARRKRSESTSSTSSWQYVNECGSVEKESFFTIPMRFQRISKVRTIFSAAYHQKIKKESYGPPKRTMVEDIIRFLGDKLKGGT